MARILISLLILIFLPPKIALAEPEQFASKTACDYIASGSFQEINSSSQIVASSETKIVTDVGDAETDKTDNTDNTDGFQQELAISTQSTPSKDKPAAESKVALAGISIPSLWWAREQFDPFGGKLISNWLTKPQVKQIDLVVNWQFWTLLDYLGRYRFINQFGTVARRHGYGLRIFNQQKQCLALYEYNQVTNPPKWEIKIEGFGQESLQVLPDIN